MCFRRTEARRAIRLAAGLCSASLSADAVAAAVVLAAKLVGDSDGLGRATRLIAHHGGIRHRGARRLGRDGLALHRRVTGRGIAVGLLHLRSEERRVGKGWGAGWTPTQE